MKPLVLAAVVACAAPALAAPDPSFDGRAGLPSPSASAGDAPATAEPAAAVNDERLWVELKAGDARSRSAAADAGISLEELRPGTAAGFATPRSLARAKAAGLTVLSARPVPERLRALGFPSQDSEYHDYARTVAELKALAAKAPGLASLFSIGKTTQGRDIWALRLCPDAKGAAPSRLPGARAASRAWSPAGSRSCACPSPARGAGPRRFATSRASSRRPPRR